MERDPELEAKAVKLLGYTAEQVKRKTMAQLKSELGDSPKRKKTVTFRRSTSSSRDAVDYLDEASRIHRCLRAKIRFTSQLEQDPDFSKDDLREWDESIRRTRKRLEKCIQRGGATGDLNEWIKRREAKVAEMDRMGLVDKELLEKWQAKHDAVREMCDE